MSNPFENYKILTILLSTVVSVFIGFLIVFAGNLNPTSAPGTTMYTLEQIYCKMTGCTPVTPHSLDSPGNPTTGTMYTLEQVYNAAPAFRTNPGNVTQDDICNSKQAYADTNTMQTGTRSTNYNGTGANYCCACRATGQACNHTDQCCSGYCSRDGYCCSTACTDACRTCSTGTCSNITTAWGGGTLYNCGAIGGVDDRRCYNGSCVQCSTGGGKMAGYTCAPGTCPTVVNMARKSDNAVCWRAIWRNTCTNACSSYGGCIQENWDDTTNCNAGRLLDPISGWCAPDTCANASLPTSWSDYSGGGWRGRTNDTNQNCGANVAGTAERDRFCVCYQ